MDDIDTVARTIWGEARGEFARVGVNALAAIAWVIKNRADLAKAYVAKRGHPHPLYGDGTPASAATARLQFSCWNENDPNRAKLLAVTTADPTFRVCWDVAKVVLAGEFPDPTNGCTHYFECHSNTPAWAEGHTPERTIGNHLFFKGV